MGKVEEGFSSKGVRGFESRQGDFHDDFQTKGVATFEFLLFARPWRETVLPGETGAWYAQEAGEVQKEQIWTLWQVVFFVS